MPRAFLVKNKPPPQQQAQTNGQLPLSEQQTDALSKKLSTNSTTAESPAEVRMSNVASSFSAHYAAPLSDVMKEQPRPCSASPVSSYVSSEDDGPFSPATSELREGRISPPSDPTSVSYPPTGVPIADIGDMFDLRTKRRRLSPNLPSGYEQACTISPGSIISESGSDASSRPSPHHGKDHAQRYMMFNPKDSASQASPSDHQVQPLSPLHHLVRPQQQHPHHPHHPALPFPAFPAAGFGMPFMRAPMFMPHHFRHYPQQVPAMMPEVQPKFQAKTEPVEEVIKPQKPSPRPRISHNIDDLLKRSPPKTKKPIDMSVEQPKPVIVQPQEEKSDVRPKEYPSSMPKSPCENLQRVRDSPMHQLVAMERMYAHSPRSIPQHPNQFNQSPKTGSYAPPSASPSSSRSKPRSVPRSLEEDFKKQYLETILPEAIRQRQQKLAEDYKQMLKLQNAQIALEKKELKEERAKDSNNRRAYVPDINRNKCFGQVEGGYIQEFARETVFPHRIGEDDSKDLMSPTLAERLSPATLESLPVDFSQTGHKKPGPPRFQCDGCKKSYSTLNGLSKHKEFHCVSHVKKEFSCKQCSKTYTSLGALKMHIRTHTLPCKCQLCGKAFSRPWLLQGHIRTHTGEKPFSCQHCQRSFADRSNLRAHLQTHTDIKRYSCETCTKTFSRMSLLTKHRENGCHANMLHH